jgi:hypothetical protein
VTQAVISPLSGGGNADGAGGAGSNGASASVFCAESSMGSPESGKTPPRRVTVDEPVLAAAPTSTSTQSCAGGGLTPKALEGLGDLLRRRSSGRRGRVLPTWRPTP